VGVSRLSLASTAIQLLLVALPSAAYLNSLPNGFVHDDHVQVEANRAIRSLRNVGVFFRADVATVSLAREPGRPESAAYNVDFVGRIRYWRPVFLLSYAIDFGIWGTKPAGYHLMNLAIHLAVTLLVYRLVLEMSSSRATALLTSLLFSVHPANTEAVNWVAARVELLCALFVVPAFFCYQRWRAGGGSVPWLLAAAGLYVLGLLSWEAAVAFPLLLAAGELTHPAATRPTQDRLIGIAAVIALTLVYLGTRTAVVGWPKLFHGAVDMDALRLRLMVLVEYARLLLFPLRLSADYPIPESSPGIADPEVLAGLALAAGVGGWVLVTLVRGWRAPRGRRDTEPPFTPPTAGPCALFWVLWVVFALLPAFYIGGFGASRLAERYLYVSSIGYSVLLAEAFLYLGRRAASTPFRWVPLGLAGLVVALFAVATVNRNPVWRDDAVFYARGVEDAPKSAVMRRNLGILLERRGLYQEAVPQFRHAIALNPRDAQPHLDLSIVYGRTGDLAAALAEVAIARNLEPASAAVHFQTGEILRAAGDLSRAREEWTAAVALAPNHSGALNNLGNVCRLEGDLACALARYRAAVAADADNAEALFNLASTAEAVGATDEAIASYQRFIGIGGASYPVQAAAAAQKLRALQPALPR
jgi:Flp pilus assembly protein TadD